MHRTIPLLAVLLGACGGAQAAAFEVCKEAVARELVSPATAQFSPPTTASNDGGAFRFSGGVDSQNRLGATLRSQYTCYVGRHPSAGHWQAEVSVF